MINDSTLRKYHRKPLDKQTTLTDRDGLYVRVSMKGKVSYFMRYRYNGKPDQLTIGTYPEMTLKQARDRNLELRSHLNEGRNPKIQKKLEVESVVGAITLNGLVDLWYEKDAKESKKNHEKIYATLNRHILKRIGEFPAAEITTNHFFDVFEEVKKKAPYQLPTIISALRQAYKLGTRRRIIDDNPLIGASASADLKVTPNEIDRVLTPDEIKRLYLYIEHKKTRNLRTALVIELCMLYGCRMGELSFSKIEHWDFFNNKWSIPPEDHKTGKKTKKALTRPIINSAEDKVKQLIELSGDGEHLVTSSKTNKPLNTSHWTKWPNIINQWLQENDYEPIPHWTMHDLRRTMRTHMARSVPPHILETMLGHSFGKVQRTYDRYEYLDEQLDAYNKWWDMLQTFRAGEDNVVEIRKV